MAACGGSRGETNTVSNRHPWLVFFRNINWENDPITFDLWINDEEVATCLQFSQDIWSIAQINFLNFDYAKVNIGDIYMANLPLDYHCPIVSEIPPSPGEISMPPLSAPTKGPVIFEFVLNAFCRSGPGVEYPELSTFPEGIRLIVTGQNLEGTWWWSEAAGCWVSNAVGELISDSRTLAVVIPPPPPQ
jgi:hypothetical protein